MALTSTVRIWRSVSRMPVSFSILAVAVLKSHMNSVTRSPVPNLMLCLLVVITSAAESFASSLPTWFQRWIRTPTPLPSSSWSVAANSILVAIKIGLRCAKMAREARSKLELPAWQ